MIHKQPVAQTREILSLRPLEKADLIRLREPRKATQISRLKDSHHYFARLFAAGLNASQIAARTGRNYNSVRLLRKSPAFENLVQEYRGMVNASWLEQVDDFFELATTNMIRSQLQIADRLARAEEDEDEVIPIRDLLAISADAADRVGYGKKQTNVNVNVDFASQLERAIKRSGKLLEPKVVEGSARVEGPAPGAAAPLTEPEASGRGDGASAAPIPFPLRRRA